MSIALHIGDCRAVLATLPDASVHCVVTSPPYWGLRDYGTATWEGGDPTCLHVEGTARNDGGRANVGTFNGSAKSDSNKGAMNFRNFCGHCGAVRIDAQLGLEPDFNAYVANMVGVFREVRRVLRDDGTCWINLGDSYASTTKGSGGSNGETSGLQNDGRREEIRIAGAERSNKRARFEPRRIELGGLKPKDLCGIPWRVAFALQADGWYLRQDIIWSKPNPMPESVTDRCTKAHEYLFLLSKRERYYYDAEAIREDAEYGRRSAFRSTSYESNQSFGNGSDRAAPVTVGGSDPSAGRNKRSVWEVTTQPFSEAHFATFPPALIEPCIKAGCPMGGTVLDPFGGAGTTGLVADRLQRNAILIELNPAYAAMSSNRIKDDAPLFAEVAQP